MTTKNRYKYVIEWFKQNVPVAETELHYQDAFSLLVAVILSAQCTDKRVNMVTPSLLRRYPTPQAMATATQEDIFDLIRSISFPNNKATHLLGMAQKLTQEFKGIVPDDVDLLQTLPGVGRKTANVILSVIFNKPAMAVDTHVFRVSERIGLTRNAKNPLQTEMQLTANIPASLLPIAHHWLILHGRYICLARKPHCAACGLTECCLYFQQKEKAIKN